jgi:hypothetical protein
MRVATETRFSCRLRGLFPVAAALVLLSSCRPQSFGGLRIESHVDPNPAGIGPAAIRIELFDRRNNSVSDARVTVEADMAHPGMKPVFAEAKPVSGNTFEAKLDFEMPGDWTILITATHPNGIRVEQQQSLTVRER